MEVAPAAAPAAASVTPVVNRNETILLAPMSGEVIAIEAVPDAAFASKAVGEGVAIRPTGNIVVAPCDGELVKIFNTNHAFALVTDSGAELIVHIGIETVKLGGQGFTRLAQQGARVKAGDPVLELDLDYLAAHAASIISPVILSNADQFQALESVASGSVEAGKTVLYTFKAK